MRSVTGIEIGADSCVLARVAPGRDAVRLSAVHGLSAGDWDPDREMSENLRRARRAQRFPRQARVVAWGVPDGASASDLSAGAAVAPVLAAGFSVDCVLSPPDALVMLASQRTGPPGRAATAWLALNQHAAAIAIVRAGRLLFSRTFDWQYRRASTAKEELLQRYSLLSHLAVELRHAFEVVRQQHAANVEAVVTCGNLPDLRSMTMPLIEELDIEVETLDTMDGLETAADLGDIEDRAPALRLACVAALGKPGVAAQEPSRVWIAAAVVAVLVGLVIWASVQLFGARTPRTDAANRTGSTGGGPPAPIERDRARAREQSGQTRSEPTAARPDAVPTSPVPVASAPARAPLPPILTEVGRAAGTAGRQAVPPRDGEGSARPPSRPSVDAVQPRPAPRRPSAATSGRTASEAAAPLADPLPVVNSILVASERRLAVVDGAIVREGERVGRRVLIRIEPAELVLREPSGREVRVAIRRKVGTPES